MIHAVSFRPAAVVHENEAPEKLMALLLPIAVVKADASASVDNLCCRHRSSKSIVDPERDRLENGDPAAERQCMGDVRLTGHGDRDGAGRRIEGVARVQRNGFAARGIEAVPCTPVGQRRVRRDCGPGAGDQSVMKRR